MPRLACLPLLALLVVTACAGAADPAEDASKFAACSDAPDVTCENSPPICFVDHDRVCRVCRCSALASIPAPMVTPLIPGSTPLPPFR